MRSAVALIAVVTSGCRAILGIDDPTFIDGDIVPGVELATLEFSSGALAAPFDSLESAIDLALPLASETVTITATVASPDLVIRLDDEFLASGVASVPLDVDVGISSFEISVTREATGERSTYTVTLDRFLRPASTFDGPGDFGDRFGGALHLDDDTLFVGAPCATAAAQSRAGIVYVYSREGTAWVETAQLTASNPTENGFFGTSLGHDGGVLAVGADGGARCGVTASPRVGRAFAFTLVGSTWEPSELAPNVFEAGSAFGAAVSVDGDFIAVGAPGQGGAGSVFLFALVSGQWEQTSELPSPNATAGDLFGIALDLNSGILTVGAPGDRGGRVHIFRNVSGVASALAIAEPSAAEIAQHGPLGFGLALAQDDTGLAVGGPTAESGSGAAWVFGLEPVGGVITHEATIGLGAGQDADAFGASLDIDEGILVVGAPGAGPGGIVSLWIRDDGGSWSESGDLPSPPDTGVEVGADIDLDGLRVAFGVPGKEDGFVFLVE